MLLVGLRSDIELLIMNWMSVANTTCHYFRISFGFLSPCLGSELYSYLLWLLEALARISGMTHQRSSRNREKADEIELFFIIIILFYYYYFFFCKCLFLSVCIYLLYCYCFMEACSDHWLSEELACSLQ